MITTLLILLKALIPVGTMVLTIGVYAMAFGWPFAIGFVALLFIHEMGHYLAAKQRGLKVGAPMFIPFVGAYIALKEVPHNVETEAYVALAGPLAGTLGALACYYMGRGSNDQLLLSLAYSAFMLNLFNLIPVSPLDGGRVTAVLSPRVWLAGFPILIGFFLFHPSPLLILIGVVAFPQLKRAWRYDKNDPANAAYYTIRPDLRILYAVYYLLLVVFLALMTDSLNHRLDLH